MDKVRDWIEWYREFAFKLGELVSMNSIRQAEKYFVDKNIRECNEFDGDYSCAFFEKCCLILKSSKAKIRVSNSRIHMCAQWTKDLSHTLKEINELGKEKWYSISKNALARSATQKELKKCSKEYNRKSKKSDELFKYWLKEKQKIDLIMT